MHRHGPAVFLFIAILFLTCSFKRHWCRNRYQCVCVCLLLRYICLPVPIKGSGAETKINRFGYLWNAFGQVIFHISLWTSNNSVTFQKGKSTSTVVLSGSQFIHAALNKNQIAVGIFLDRKMPFIPLIMKYSLANKGMGFVTLFGHVVNYAFYL